MRNYNDSDELESYGSFEHKEDFRKFIDERNSKKVMREQFDLMKKQKQEIIDNRKSSKRAFFISIVGIVIALLSLIVSMVSLFS